MRISVLSVTKKGAETGMRIVKALEAHETELFVNKRYPVHGATPIDEPLAGLAGRLFTSRDALVFVSSTGIALRCIARHIRDKASDPAVVVVDEAGRHVISLLSGHLGGANALAKEIARGIGGEAVVTTATDVQGRMCVEDLARRLGLTIDDREGCKGVNAALANGERVGLFCDSSIPPAVASGFAVHPLEEMKDRAHDLQALVIITDREIERPRKPHVLLRPRDLVVGVGSKKGVSASQVVGTVESALRRAGLSPESVRLFATADFKADEEGIKAAARSFGVPLAPVSMERIKEAESGFASSDFVKERVGAGAVAEPAAVLASEKGVLVQGKVKGRGATAAIARDRSIWKGRITLVGIGPGGRGHMSLRAREAIEEADSIVTYEGYLSLIEDMIGEREVFSNGMMGEVKRAEEACERAERGERVAVVCSGDPGVYAMASLVCEMLCERGLTLDLEVVPGITSATASAALLGAPLSTDFAVISLSDHLTPWERIEKRLEAAAESDFVIVLYNPKSRRRTWQLERAARILLRHRHPETPVGVVRSATREGEEAFVTTLRELAETEADMMTTVIIGNSQTFTYRGLMITPRGYSGKYSLG
ncbi:MAG: precorrin-3B C(17)-methyltransferase [Methanobacteriota archaeon]|nr:MAG: precorrin-3B C(17)-methyltransferase [Euryarchaeota archaeon]